MSETATDACRGQCGDSIEAGCDAAIDSIEANGSRRKPGSVFVLLVLLSSSPLFGGEPAARPLGYQYMATDWTQVFDGIVFTKTMFGSTLRAR